VITYDCIHQTTKRTYKWQCSLEIRCDTPPYELEISTQGSFFRVICGPHSYGNFLCMPNWDIGCELAGFSDVFWNTERLTRHVSMRDAKAIAQGLAFARNYLK
jgi:hypothetical protein